MARRLVVLPSSSGMALVLLLVVAVMLGVPSSATSDDEGSSSSSSEGTKTTTTTTTTTSSSSSSPTPAAAAADQLASSDGSHELGSSSSSPEKQKEKAVAKEAEKALQQEMLNFAKAKHIVSHTNGTGSYKGMAREFLDAHNTIRQRYGVAPIKWDKKMARLARRWSNHMRTACEIEHSGIKGQSVYVSHDDWNATATEAVLYWAKEEPIYDKDTEKCKNGLDYQKCGHFALMVKKRTAKVGCGRAECYKGGVFITCNYTAGDPNNNKKKESSSKQEDKEDKQQQQESSSSSSSSKEKNKQQQQQQQQESSSSKEKNKQQQESSNDD